MATNPLQTLEGAAIQAGIAEIPDLLVRLMDKIFPKGSGTTVKLPVATEALGAITNGLATATGKPAPALTTADLTKTIQASVDKLQAQGQLKGAATVIDPAAVSASSGSAAVSGLLPSKLMKGFATLFEELGQ